MSQQQQQSHMIKPTKIGAMKKGAGKMMKKRKKQMGNPSMAQVEKSVKKTMGYGN